MRIETGIEIGIRIVVITNVIIIDYYYHSIITHIVTCLLLLCVSAPLSDPARSINDNLIKLSFA